MKGIIPIILLISAPFSTLALRCYTCSVTESDLDQRCVTDPDNVESGSPITDCNKRYCFSIRVQYLDPKNVVQSMYRSCADTPPVPSNQVIEDGTFRTYYRICQTDLCNGGSGTGTSGGSLQSDTQGSGVLLVPGKGNAIRLLSTPLLFICGYIINVILM